MKDFMERMMKNEQDVLDSVKKLTERLISEIQEVKQNGFNETYSVISKKFASQNKEEILNKDCEIVSARELERVRIKLETKLKRRNFASSIQEFLGEEEYEWLYYLQSYEDLQRKLTEYEEFF